VGPRPWAISPNTQVNQFCRSAFVGFWLRGIVATQLREGPVEYSFMSDGTPAREALKRLLDAEQQAREILTSAEERAREAISKAEEQAARTIQTAQEEAAASIRVRLNGAESKAAAEAQQRLEKLEAEAREIQRRAQFYSGKAIDMVVDWVIARGG
jgi:vacuolar-type H+-ATPase subunit H